MAKRSRSQRSRSNKKLPHQKKGKKSRFNKKKRHPEESRSKEKRRDSSSGEPIVFQATVQKNKKGFGFFSLNSSEFEDIFIPPPKAKAYFHGDRVKITATPNGEVTQIELIEHRFKEIVGKFYPNDTSGGWVHYVSKSTTEEIFIPESHSLAKKEDWVRVKLTFPKRGPYSVVGEITDVYGPELTANADIAIVTGEFGLKEEHSQVAIDEAKAFTLDPEKEIAAGRTDLRHLPWMTIDGEDARDFDDAVCVEKTESGYTLWVAIADVSHYVKTGTVLDDEAFERSTSVYFPERAFHMLPKALSENLCSLKPNEPRLALTAKIEFSNQGAKKSTQIMNSVIESKRRATYKEIEGEKKDFPHYFDLFRLLKKIKSDRGSIDFDIPEAKVFLNDQFEPIQIEVFERGDSHKLIEEFMIITNEAVTEWMIKKGKDFLFRIHEIPSHESLEKFYSFLAHFGIENKLKDDVTPKDISLILDQVKDHPAENLFRTMLLRAMRQAVYSAVHDIHFGLASQGYTHFTSPIRRYPDLVVHRLIKSALENKKNDSNLEMIAEHCSYRERLAVDAERLSIKLKQIRYMKNHIGKTFPGFVNGMADKGLFIQIASPYIEGFLPKEEIGKGLFEFDEKRMIFFNKRSNFKYQIGDEVQIQVVRASLEDRVIEFSLPVNSA